MLSQTDEVATISGPTLVPLIKRFHLVTSKRIRYFLFVVYLCLITQCVFDDCFILFMDLLNMHLHFHHIMKDHCSKFHIRGEGIQMVWANEGVTHLGMSDVIKPSLFPCYVLGV